jgi:hypothetical protein
MKLPQNVMVALKMGANYAGWGTKREETNVELNPLPGGPRSNRT